MENSYLNMAIRVSELSVQKAITISQAFLLVFKVIGCPANRIFCLILI